MKYAHVPTVSEVGGQSRQLSLVSYMEDSDMFTLALPTMAICACLDSRNLRRQKKKKLSPPIV